MKRLEKILVNIVGTVVALYAIIVLLFSLPFMQQRLAGWTAHLLSRQVKSNVEVGSINLGLLNRIIVNDVTIYEPTGERMAHIARVAARVNLVSLLSGRVDIGAAQLFGVKAQLWKATPGAPLNCLFLIDAFKSKEQEEPSKTDLHIGSLIMRHADISYDVLSEEARPATFDAHHLRLHDCGMNLMLKCLTDDSLNLTVRRLQAIERNSGLSLQNTQFRLAANREQGTLAQLRLGLPHSQLAIDSLQVRYGRVEQDSTFQIHGTPLHGSITPSDLAPLYAPLTAFTTPLRLNLHIEGNEEAVDVKTLSLQAAEDRLQLQATARLTTPLHPQTRNLHTDLYTLHANMPKLTDWIEALAPNHGLQPLLEAMQELTFAGAADYTADGTLASTGAVSTGLGHARYDLTYDSSHVLTGTLQADSVNLGELIDNQQFGTTSFDLDLSLNTAQTHPMPVGSVDGQIHNIHYGGYNYQNITLNARSTATQVTGKANIHDPNLQGQADFAYGHSPAQDIQFHLLLDEFRPHTLRLTDSHAGDNLSLAATAQLHGSDFGHLYGEVSIDNLQLATPSDTYRLDHTHLCAERQDDGTSRYTIGSDILSATIQGHVALADIVRSFTNQVGHHLPVLVRPQEDTQADFTYDLTLHDAPLLHHLTDIDLHLPQPVHVAGQLHTADQQMDFALSAPQVDYNGKQYDDVALTCHATDDNMNLHALLSTTTESDDDDKPSLSTLLDVVADIHDNRVSSDLYANINGRNHVIMQLLPVVQFSDSLGKLKTHIALRQSSAVLNDTIWTMSPSHITLYQKNIECHNVKFANEHTNSYLTLNGRASDSPTDSLVATLNNLEIKYLLSLIDFTAVRFSGRASGQVVVNNVLGSQGVPDLKANLSVEDLTLQEGMMGDAKIEAHWDQEVEGIAVDGRIVDLYSVPDGLTGRTKNRTGVTTVQGWVSPAKNDIKLDINTHNTNASFIHGFLGSVFKEANGYVNGQLSVVGPLNDINIVGDAVPNMNLRLRATNVPYHIEGDTLRFRHHLFDFRNISLYDRAGHRSTLNGQVTHRNMKDFAYHFKAELHEMLAYDETQFNSDKFMATVFADGNLSIDGSDGHPLYVNASVTPTRGSVFAYDAATPDAITGSAFIEFRDRDSLPAIAPQPHDLAAHTPKDSLAIVKAARRNYSSDIFINFDINLTPACEVKLRMDNIEDGYMRTFGNAQLTARWYNKGSFQLFGNYNINAGSYRLYLQDIIFRDLALQPGSTVEFNGNPFDANIHLLCHHTLNSVPLSDLTSTTAFSQNNKAKVICVLDITGKLGNMDFKFDMELPNVSEETRQLVRSIITSEEEMNTQMIYLLGVGRFYPNLYARANGNDTSSQAVNSLLSSTLSGQLNQMLSNIMGNNSNWNIGSSLSTGEQGWEDLDVEGILEGRLLDERLLINGNFGYRDNALTNQTNFIGDFEVKWRMTPQGNLFVKAYNQTNDRYFTKATLNTQGIGLTWQHDFEVIRQRLRSKQRLTKK